MPTTVVVVVALNSRTPLMLPTPSMLHEKKTLPKSRAAKACLLQRMQRPTRQRPRRQRPQILHLPPRILLLPAQKPALQFHIALQRRRRAIGVGAQPRRLLLQIHAAQIIRARQHTPRAQVPGRAVRHAALLDKHMPVQLDLQFTDFRFIRVLLVLGAVFIQGEDLADDDLGLVGGIDDDVDQGFGFGDALDDPARDGAAVDAGREHERQDEDGHGEREQLHRGEEGGAGDEGGDAGAFAEEAEEGPDALVAVADDGDDDQDGVAGPGVLFGALDGGGAGFEAGETFQHAGDAVFGFVELGDDTVAAADSDVVRHVGDEEFPGLFEGELGPVLGEGGSGHWCENDGIS